MFIGAIESEFRRWFDLNKEAFRGRTLFIGCSGNFTIEQLLGSVAGAVHSNDVSIYSHFVGHHLAGQPVTCAIKDPDYEWLRPSLEANLGAAVVLLFELLKWDPAKNIYNKRIYDYLRGEWQAQFEATATRVEQAKAIARVTTYRSSDIWDFVDEAGTIDPAGVFLAFLPFYKGGYEKLYRKLSSILSWQEPRYQIIDAARKAKLIERIKRFDHVFIDDVEYPAEPAVMLKKKTATKSMWLYSNMPVKRLLVQAHHNYKPTHYPQLTAADLPAVTPDSVVTIKRVTSAEVNYYRNRYLAKNILFADGQWSYLFFLDGKLFGFAILALSKFGGDGLYLMSDFVVPVEDSRLSKLLAWLLQSTHFRDVAEEQVLARVPTLDTTAFTERAVSMKYRGVFELIKRGEQPGGKKFLQYRTATGLHSDQEAIRKWIRSRKSSKK
jgi:hypothetical protein